MENLDVKKIDEACRNHNLKVEEVGRAIESSLKAEKFSRAVDISLEVDGNIGRKLYENTFDAS